MTEIEDTKKRKQKHMISVWFWQAMLHTVGCRQRPGEKVFIRSSFSCRTSATKDTRRADYFSPQSAVLAKRKRWNRTMRPKRDVFWASDVTQQTFVHTPPCSSFLAQCILSKQYERNLESKQPCSTSFGVNCILWRVGLRMTRNAIIPATSNSN